MREVNLEKLKAQIPERAFDVAAENSRFFQMGETPGHARALWNFTVALMDAEVDDFATAYRIAEESKDLAHLCGFHKLRWRGTRWHEMRWFFTKLWHDPSLISLKPSLREYIEHICENSRVQWGKVTRPMGLMEMPFAPYVRLPWRTPEWLKARRPAYVPRVRIEPMMEFYPYIAKSPNEDHDLLLAVDRAVGQRLPPQWRGDFCQDLLVSILCGELAVENLHDEIPNYLTKFKREMPSKYKEISLDALIFSQQGGGPTYAERLVAKSPDEMTDEELNPVRMTGRYGGALADCQTAEQLAERLKDAWDVNRLRSGDRKSYAEFAKANRDQRQDERETYKLRQRYALSREGHVTTLERPRLVTWSSETELPPKDEANPCTD